MLNIEEMAKEQLNDSPNDTNSEQNQVNENVFPQQNTKPQKQSTPFDEMNNLFKQKFLVALKNLKIKEKDILDAAEQLFEKFAFEKTYRLPYNKKITLRSKKVFEELDTFTFLNEALRKDMPLDEFNFVLRVRNLAYQLAEFNDEDFREKSFEEKFEYLMQLPTPLLNIILTTTQEFNSIILLMSHPEVADFLLKKTQS